MPKRYPPEFRRRVLELLRAGRAVTEIAAELGVSSQSIYNWRRQERIDAGLIAGVTSTEHAEFIAARRRIARLSCCGRRCPQKAFRGHRGDRG
jgi:transposase-like protein